MTDHEFTKGDQVAYTVMYGGRPGHPDHRTEYGTITRVRAGGAAHLPKATIAVENPQPRAAKYVERYVRDIRLMKPYVVTDSKGVEVGNQTPVLGDFATEQEAAEFISTLPEHLTGRYNLDGPADDGEQYDPSQYLAGQLDRAATDIREGKGDPLATIEAVAAALRSLRLEQLDQERYGHAAAWNVPRDLAARIAYARQFHPEGWEPSPEWIEHERQAAELQSKRGE